MDRRRLTRKLTHVLAQEEHQAFLRAAAVARQFGLFGPDDPRPSITPAISLATEIAEVLGTEEPFATRDLGFWVWPDGWWPLKTDRTAHLITSWLALGATPEQCVARLQRVLATRTTRGVCVLVLSGVQLEEAVELGNGISLTPFDALAPSSHKRSFLRSWAFPGFPMAALTLRESGPFVTSRRQDRASVRSRRDVMRELDDARLCLTLSGPCGPAHLAFWFQHDDNDLDHFGAIGMWGAPESVGSAVQVPRTVVPDVSRRVVQRFRDLDAASQSRMRLALRWLNQGVRRRGPERAAELAISLESLLVDDNAADINYRLGLRAALLLGGATEDRKATRKRMKDLYAARSDIVHSGQPCDKHRRKPALLREVLAHSETLCADVLTAVLERGGIPDWNVFELTPVEVTG